MNPRIRIFVVLLAVALMAVVPSTASAASACGSDLPPYAAAMLDTTAPSAAWQQGVPAGNVDIPLLGGASIDQWEYKIACGAPVNVIGAGGTATVSGQGTFRFTHRAHDSVTNTGPTGSTTSSRSTRSFPANTTTPPTASWRKGPVNVPLTADASAARPCTREWRIAGGPVLDDRQLGHVNGTGAHQLETAAVDAAGNRSERNDTVRVDNTLPVDTTITPVGWQNGAVDVPVTATDADSGVDRVEWQIDAQAPGSGPEGTVVRIGTHGIHNFRTRSVDEVGNLSAWIDHTVMVNIAGPGDTTVIPSGWITDPSVDLDITADPNGSPGIQRIQWRLDGVTTGDVAGTDTTPVTVTGDGIHELEVRITDDWGRINDWHTHQVKIDTVDPVDNTTVAAGWLPLTYLDVLVRGTDQHSQVQGVEWRLDGGDVLSASTNNHEVRVAGNGDPHARDPHGRQRRPQEHLEGPHDQAGLDAADQHHPDRPRRLAQHALLGRARRLGRRLRRVLGALAHRPRERARRRRDGRRPRRRARRDRPRRLARAPHPHPRRRRQLLHLARRADPHRPRAPHRRHGLSGGAVGNRHVVTFNPQDDRSGVAGVEWKLDNGSGHAPPARRRSPAPARTR